MPGPQTPDSLGGTRSPGLASLGGLLSVSWVSRQVRLPAGGGAEDARGLFWILDEEVRVEGSQDSVVLERLCAASEKHGAGAEGEGGSQRGGGCRPAWELASLLEALVRPALGAVHLPGRARIHPCIHHAL